MTIKKNGNNMSGIWRIACILAIWACFLLLVIQSPEAYAETKKVTGTSKLAYHLEQVTISSSGKTPVRITNRLYTLNSADPDWDNASFYYIAIGMDTDMVDSCQEENKPPLQLFFQRSLSWIDSKAFKEAEPVLRRLITLIFAGWLPHDYVSSWSCLYLIS